MEPWLFFSITAYVLFALANIGDKYFMEKVFRSPMQYSIFGGIMIIPVFFLMPFTGFSISSMQMAAFGILTGALFLFSLIPYFKALSLEDATTVIPLGSFNPLLVLVISFFVLGESLSVFQLSAFALMVAGGAFLAVNGIGKGRIMMSPALGYVALSWIIFAIDAVMVKILYNNVSFTEGFYLLRIGTVICSLFLFFVPSVRKGFQKSFPMLGIKKTLLFSAVIIVAIAGHFMYEISISMGSISLVSAAQGVQYIFLFFFAVFLSRFFPGIIKERTDLVTLARKGIGISLVAFGLLLLAA